jgi:hypothetical protein
MSNRAQEQARDIERSRSYTDDSKRAPIGQVMRLPQTSTADLRWFWNDAAGALGLKGLNTDGAGGGGGDIEDTHRVEAATRYREISLLLDRVGPWKTRILQRYHQEAVWRGLESFGVMAGIALVTRKAKAAYREDAREGRLNHGEFAAWLKALGARTMLGMSQTVDDRALRLAILSEAELLLSRACSAYDAVKTLRMSERRAEKSAKNTLIRIESAAHVRRLETHQPFRTDETG